MDSADKLADQITPLEIASTLREDLGFAKARPHEIHELITNLGPERFVTTNFDSLIEQQLGLQNRLGEFRTVTNRQVADLADIQKASANHFIFKPHGDLSEAESLVLSSTQYDRILFGSANLVRATLDTLFVSRPVLFIGYGLRDPDMLILLRSLKERYNGNAGELWAIVADASNELMEYYWRQYRLRVVGYPTTSNGASHQELISLLRKLRPQLNRKLASNFPTKSSDQERELIRYAARLIQPTSGATFPLKVLFGSWHNRGRFPEWIQRFHGASLASLLEELPASFILQGPAGSGKSFALGERIARAGRKLLDWCLSDDKQGDAPDIPILLDARLYRGHFDSLVAATVPRSLDLATLSQSHTIILIVDSLDEMPSEYLDSGQWRSELEKLMASLDGALIQFGTRRADLAPDPSLPVFLIHSLDDQFVRSNLEEMGRCKEDVSPDLFNALKTPFVLTLGRRLLGYHRDIASAPALFSRFLTRSLEAAAPTSPDDTLKRLSKLAADVLASGFDTIPIEHVAFKLGTNKDQHTSISKDGRRFLDRLVSVGIFVSEIDEHVRFAHRSITEFLAANYLANSWRSNDASLENVLAVRRWDNAIAWAAALLNDPEAEQLLRDVYIMDAELAAAIAHAAEIGKDNLWSTFVDLLISYPLSDERQRELVYAMENWTIPDSIVPKLKSLTDRDDELGGWAAAMLLPFQTGEDICTWIDRLRKNRKGFNFLNWFSPALGERIDNDKLLSHLLTALETSDAEASQMSDRAKSDPDRVQFDYSGLIGNIPKPQRDALLAWSRKKSTHIRGIICSGLREINNDLTVQKYLTEQFDRGVPQAVFSLYLGLRYGKGTWRWWSPRFTVRRNKMLVAPIRENAPSRWEMELLRSLAERDADWRLGLKETAKGERNTALRRILLALASSPKSAGAKSIVVDVLKKPDFASEAELNFCSLATDYEFELEEPLVLAALGKNVRRVLKILNDLFLGGIHEKIELKIERALDWIAIIHSEFREDEWLTDGPLSFVCRHLARATPISDHQTLISMANDPKDHRRDFILSMILLHIVGVTTDQLNKPAALRLLEMYVKGKMEPVPSPGEVATENFIAEIVLPYAEAIGSDPWERSAVEQILLDAGRRHDRRYQAPWFSTIASGTAHIDRV
ncbi:SIR2 family protein [Bradyrhizobium sp. RDT46]|uniref:SIR2 family protein n=1 Tax=Bradyrhizobium sp. RDT46 TaxID=3341829 RepID=UPI0035C713BF